MKTWDDEEVFLLNNKVEMDMQKNIWEQTTSNSATKRMSNVPEEKDGGH